MHLFQFLEITISSVPGGGLGRKGLRLSASITSSSGALLDFNKYEQKCSACWREMNESRVRIMSEKSQRKLLTDR